MPIPAPRILLSYWYFKKVDVEAFLKELTPHKLDVMADSGAFSAFGQNATIDPHEYADWLHRWKHCFSMYSNLDVKANWREGLRNQRLLESKGLKPFPVFHAHHAETFDLWRDLAKEYDMLALGGMAGSHTPRATLIRWVLKCFEEAEGKKIHGFGMTGGELVVAATWFSVDSSSWTSGVRFGSVRMFDANKGKMFNFSLKQRSPEMARLLASVGVDINSVASRGGNANLLAAQGLSMGTVETYIQRIKGRKVKFYLSTDRSTFNLAFKAIKNAKVAIEWQTV